MIVEQSNVLPTPALELDEDHQQICRKRIDAALADVVLRSSSFAGLRNITGSPRGPKIATKRATPGRDVEQVWLRAHSGELAGTLQTSPRTECGTHLGLRAIPD